MTQHAPQWYQRKTCRLESPSSHAYWNRQTVLSTARTATFAALAVALVGGGTALAQSAPATDPPPPPPAFGPSARPVSPEEAARQVFETNRGRQQDPSTTGTRATIPTATANAPRSLVPAPARAATEEEVVLQADEIGQDDEPNVVTASGNVVARQGGRTLRADRLVYNQTTGVVRAFGNVLVVEPDGASTFSDELTVDDELATGVATNFSARFTNGGVVAASAAVRREGDRSFLSRAIYTACPVCKDGKDKPTWAIRARRALQDERAQTIVYNDVVFEVEGVPVLYMPYFMHGDPSVGRRSGLLQPKPGQSSRLGYFWEQPYLFVIDRSSDLTVSPMVSQYVNPLVNMQYRRKFFSGDLMIDGSVTHERLFLKDGVKFGEATWRSHIFADAAFKINETWTWGFGAERASDDLYFQRYSIGGQGVNRGLVRAQSSRLLSQVYLEGSDDRFYGRVLAVAFQDLRGLSAEAVPAVTPMVEASRNWSFGPANGVLTASGSALALWRGNDGRSSARVTGGLRWRGSQVIGRGIVVEPQAFVRADHYRYEDPTIPGSDRNLSRALGLASVDFRWPFMRPGTRFNATLEPRISLTYASNDSEQSSVINEETSNFELDSTGLFRAQGSGGYDLWDPGARITAGLSAGLDIGPQTRLRGFIGRQWRSEVNPAYTRNSNLDRKASDWVGEADIAWRSNLNFTSRLRFDGETGSLARLETAARANFWRFDADVRYIHFPEKTAGADFAHRETSASLRVRVTKNLKLFGTVLQDHLGRTTLQSRAGILYNDDCTDLRLYYEETETRNRFIEPSRAIRFQVAFKTLGVLTDSEFD